MRRAALLGLLLCFPSLAAAQPFDVAGSWKVPGRTGGVIGTVRFQPLAGKRYRARFILGDGSVKELEARFDGRTLTTYRRGAGATAASAPGDSGGAVGALTGASGGDAEPGSVAGGAALERTGAYTLRRTTATIDGKRQRTYRFDSVDPVDRDGLNPVAAFARVAYRLRVEGPSVLRVGQDATFKARLAPGNVRGDLSWSVSGAYAYLHYGEEQTRIETREPGTIRVFCRFTPAGGTEGAVYETTHTVTVKPAFDAIRLAGVTYRSDHGVLTDHDGDWNQGGAPFPEPEWTPAQQHPISHTLGQKVRVRVTLEIEPRDAPPFKAYLRGDGPGDVDFRQRVTLRGGRQTVNLTSVAKLPRAIRPYDLNVRWRYTMRDTTRGPEIGVSETPVFLTLGEPKTPGRRPGITLKRMRQAVKAIAGAGSLEPHAIAKHVIGKWSRFNLDVAYWNAWELGDDKVDPDTGKLVGADCQTIVRYTENVIRMAGVPGKTEFIVVWAKVESPEKARANEVSEGHMGNPVQWHNEHFRARDARAGWAAYLIDGNNRPNNYEAALRFTYRGEKLYYPGGVRAVMSNADQVLRVFGSMSWVDTRDGYKVKDAIVRYR